ncbi:MAG: ABC transporter substrate-binding protein [Clostridia bacterium]|nr:ABC transporter substrate-binding protein [Clostridia bacterium]
MSRRLCCFLLAVSAVLGLFSACGESEGAQTGAYYTFTDGLGVSISLPEKPERVAVLFSSLGDIWLLSGGELCITVGETVERGLVDEASVTLCDSGAGKSVNTEVLLAAEPDFVICSADIGAQREAAAMLNSSGIPAACFRVDSFEDYLAMLKICTDITQNREAYRVHGAELAKRVEHLIAGTAGKDGGEILFVRSGSGASSAKAKTPEMHFAAAMLRDIGTENVASAAPVLLDGLSIEAVIAADPDIIFISVMGNEEAARAHMDSVLASEPWQALSAVREGRVYYLPRELFQYKPNASWDEAYQYLIGKVYGESEK